jgi:hypothetical protein
MPCRGRAAGTTACCCATRAAAIADRAWTFPTADTAPTTRQNHPHWHGANIRPSQFRTEPESQVVRRRRAPHRDAVRQAVTLRSGGFPGRK